MRTLIRKSWVPASLVGLTLLLPTGLRAETQRSDEHSPAKVPAGVILVKGAWSSASGQTTALPEGGRVSAAKYDSPYFHLTYPLPAGWIQKYEGPPPSDSGFYVLAQIQPGESLRSASRGTVMITAQDMFFSPIPAQSPLDLINYTKTHLRADYVSERGPTELQIGGHTFVRLDYESPSAGLHWSVLATAIRCHTVQFTFTSADSGLIEKLTVAMAQMGLSDDSPPICVSDYANSGNLLSRTDPFLTERRYNPIPLRVIIGTDGKIKHIHFISAFPDQAKIIADALQQWRFKPYLANGKATEVETGIMFGRPAPAHSPAVPAPRPAANKTLISGKQDPQLVPARNRDPT
jgi:hypothetical protein